MNAWWRNRPRPLRVLITNWVMTGPGGTQSVTRDLARKLMASGHSPTVYSPLVGQIGEEVRRSGIPVLDDLTLMAEPPDIIHGHHSVPTAEAIIRFPRTPAIHVCHAWAAGIEAPVVLPQVQYHVGVDQACIDRIRHTAGVDPARVRLIANAVALDRFPNRSAPLPERPRKAVAFGKAVKLAPILQAVCADLGMSLQVIGGAGERATMTPETHLVKADLVFASARAALEAICAGCAVIVCDGRGVAGMATSHNFESLRENNFGLRTLTLPPRAKILRAQIECYDQADATALSGRARAESDLDRALVRYLKLYRRAIKRMSKQPVDPEQHILAILRFLRTILPRSVEPELSMDSLGRDAVGRLIDLSAENAYLKRSLEAAQARASDAGE